MDDTNGNKRLKKKSIEPRVLLGNGDEMLMCLPVMHCSKMKEDGENEVTGREVEGDIRRQADESKMTRKREE